MGNGFELRIGMTTQQVMSNISRMNATDKTKQMIINFCNNDQDKKISNEIELAMLNSWASGSEKVKMPTAERMKKVNISQVQGSTSGTCVNDDGTDYNYYRTNNNNRFLGISSDNRFVHTTTDIYNYNNKTNTRTNVMDSLIDNDNDGYADIRTTHYSNVNNEDEETYFTTNYKDNNLDGLYDVKQTSTNTMNINKHVHITTNTTTDLATGHTKTETKTHNFKTGEDSVTVEEE